MRSTKRRLSVGNETSRIKAEQEGTVRFFGIAVDNWLPKGTLGLGLLQIVSGLIIILLVLLLFPK